MSAVSEPILISLRPFMHTVANIKKHIKPKRDNPPAPSTPSDAPLRPRINSLINIIDEPPVINKRLPKPKPFPSNIFVGEHDFQVVSTIDSLFWITFIIHNGEFEYNIITRGAQPSLSLLKDKKIEYINKLRENYKNIIKPLKIDTLANIEEQLIHTTSITPSIAIVLCAINKHNICYISKNKFHYLLICEQKSQEITIIHRTGKSQNYNYSYKQINISELCEYTKNTIQVTNLNMPLKRLSAYMSNELVEMCTSLQLPTINPTTQKKMTKQCLYDQLLGRLN